MTRIEKIEPDFLDSERKIIDEPKRRFSTLGKGVVSLALIAAVFVGSFGFGVISSGEQLAKKFGNVGLLGQLRHLVSSDDRTLDGEQEDRINILLLGMGGENHDGPYLTDTLMLASFKPSTQTVALISIPRDLLVNIPGYGWRKINNANAFGENKDPGNGGELAKETVSEMLDLPVHYYVRIDFEGFKQVIDDLGGVKIDVENIINDYQYPVRGKEDSLTERYEHLYIEPGLQDMDGDLALKYVRSRHSSGVEGSDFARSKRQQKVIMAAKDKALSFSTIANPYKISKVMDTMSKHLATDLEVWQILRLYNLGKDVNEDDIIRLVFDDSPQGMLRSAVTEYGAYVLQPRSGNFNEMQQAAQNIFATIENETQSAVADTNQQVLSTQKTAEEQQEKPEPAQPANIEIQNGTKINGLASKTKISLSEKGYTINAVGNAPTQDYQKTVIYFFKNEHAEEARSVARLLGAEVSSSKPDWVTLREGIKSSTNILIILGSDTSL